MLDGKAWVEKEIQLSAAAIATSPSAPAGARWIAFRAS
jgi:hypothetical protein